MTNLAVKLFFRPLLLAHGNNFARIFKRYSERILPTIFKTKQCHLLMAPGNEKGCLILATSTYSRRRMLVKFSKFAQQFLRALEDCSKSFFCTWNLHSVDTSARFAGKKAYLMRVMKEVLRYAPSDPNFIG